MTVEERLKSLEEGNASLAERVATLEKQAGESKEVYETLAQTVSCAVGDMQEAHNNTLTHFMGSLDKKVQKLVAEGIALSSPTEGADT